MTTKYDVDLCIIGAGSGGLSVAAGAAQLGRSVVLFEAEEMGGDCLNHGCVPSKALIAAGKHAHALSSGAAFGVAPAELNVDFKAVKAHVQGIIDHIAPTQLCPIQPKCGPSGLLLRQEAVRLRRLYRGLPIRRI